jgi:endonuclease YncB( thermonuclease family)
VIDLGFGVRSVQTLRLRRLDAPEIESREGREAKEFLTKLLRGTSAILIRTTKSDKYDRYLADIFIRDLYVNQDLVKQGHATVVSE